MSAESANLPARLKVGMAIACLALASLAGWRSSYASWAARALLAVSVLLALMVWLRRRGNAEALLPLSRLRRVASTSLDSKGGAASLLQVDGALYLVVHGQGFARVSRVAACRDAHSHRPRALERAPRSLRSKVTQ